MSNHLFIKNRRETIMEIREELFNLRDIKYKEFQSKLIPTIAKDKIIGVRVPEVRRIAKKYANTSKSKKFLENLPHKYYDENMLHGLLLSEIKDYDLCLKEVNRFLPYVDNWAVCDIMSPKVFKNKKHKEDLINEIIKWSKSSNTYECRFGIRMLMAYYLDENFKNDYLDIVVNIHSDEYYVNMMIAWFFATALAKEWDDAILYLEKSKLDKWVHNKTIQKARESYRITKEQKEYLKSLKRL